MHAPHPQTPLRLGTDASSACADVYATGADDARGPDRDEERGTDDGRGGVGGCEGPETGCVGRGCGVACEIREPRVHRREGDREGMYVASWHGTTDNKSRERYGDAQMQWAMMQCGRERGGRRRCMNGIE